MYCISVLHIHVPVILSQDDSAKAKHLRVAVGQCKWAALRTLEAFDVDLRLYCHFVCINMLNFGIIRISSLRRCFSNFQSTVFRRSVIEDANKAHGHAEQLIVGASL